MMLDENQRVRKIYNFNPGPSMLPDDVLLTVQSELLDWHGTGMSIMELGHRGPEFQQVAEQAEADLRALMAIPPNYRILFLPGGATAQFAMVPLNLFSRIAQADYIDTGTWSRKAIQEAKRYGDVHIAASLIQESGLVAIPPQSAWHLRNHVSYVHYTPNETIEGVEFNWVPKTDAPLVADMSSMILSRPIDVSQYGIIYAGAQKNVGGAGITIVIIRDDLLTEALPATPTLYQYQLLAEHHSFYNTPPTFNWYLSGLVLAWMKRHGGVSAFYARNQKKAKMLYQAIDTSNGFYRNTVHPGCRSMMNVVFTLDNEALLPLFLQEAQAIGLANLKGHRIAGGLRASIYNAMPEAGVSLLVDFMKEFMRQRG